MTNAIDLCNRLQQEAEDRKDELTKLLEEAASLIERMYIDSCCDAAIIADLEEYIEKLESEK